MGMYDVRRYTWLRPPERIFVRSKKMTGCLISGGLTAFRRGASASMICSLIMEKAVMMKNRVELQMKNVSSREMAPRAAVRTVICVDESSDVP